MADQQQSINIPQVLVLAVLGFLVFRWYWSSSTAAATPTTASPNTTPINPAQVEQLTQMFPQVDRRTLMWELQRNRGNVRVVTEIVLSGRALQTPPQSFQPDLPPLIVSGRPGSTTGRSKPTHPDLITRYNLQSKLSSAETPPIEAVSEDKGKKTEQGWSNNKAERQALLQKRRDDMILAARRKLEEKEKSGTA